MKKAILATKVGMTQIFNNEGVLVPVTVLQAGPCVVTQVKTEENDGYKAVQVGFVDKREKLVNKPVKGHFDKAGVSYKRYVREFRFENAEEYNVKDEIKADIFAEGDKVDATAISKGKGFQGAIKRHNQHRDEPCLEVYMIAAQTIVLHGCFQAVQRGQNEWNHNGAGGQRI